MPVWYSDPDPVFRYAMRVVTGITNTENAVITTSVDHGYDTGLIVRLHVPTYYGMRQINKKRGTIIVLTDDTFRIDIDTTKYDSFAAPPYSQYYWETAYVVPIAVTVDNDSSLAFKNIL